MAAGNAGENNAGIARFVMHGKADRAQRRTGVGICQAEFVGGGDNLFEESAQFRALAVFAVAKNQGNTLAERGHILFDGIKHGLFKHENS